MKTKSLYRILASLTLFSFCFFQVFYLFTGVFFVRSDLSDWGFHHNRSLDPLCFLDGSCTSYPPLFHLIIYFFCGLGLDSVTSFSLVVSILSFFLVPISLHRLSSVFWGNEGIGVTSCLIYLFGSVISLVMIVDGVYPQLLTLFFVVMGLCTMVQNLQKNPGKLILSPFLWGFLAVFSHRGGGLLYIVILCIWLLLKKQVVVIIVFLVGLYSLSISPHIHNLSFHRLFLRQQIEIFFFWLNPVTLWLAYRGMKTKHIDKSDYLLDKSNYLLWFVIAITILFSWVDPTYRPLIYTSALLSVYGGKGFYGLKENRFKIILFFAVMWLSAFMFCFLGIYGLSLK